MAKTKKKVNWVILAAALAGILIGLSVLGINLLSPGILSILAGLSALAMLFLYAYKNGQIDWTVTIVGLIYIAQYLVPVGYIWSAYDLHASLLASSGLGGLILLFTRAELM